MHALLLRLAILLDLYLPLVLAGSAADQPTLLRAPYLQSVLADRATIVWTTDRAGNGEVILSDGQGPPRTLGASSRLVNGHYDYAATATGLRPGTSYVYRVRFAGQPEDLVPAGSLTTATRGGNFAFVALGDSRNGWPDAVKVAQQMARWPFDFALHTGDIVLSGTYEQYDTQYFAIYSDLIRKVPFYPALGNHDYGVNPPRPYLDAFHLPEDGPGGLTERVYSFDWGNAHFVALDTNVAYGPGSVQYAWLAKDLASTDRQWKFVFFHHPPYSSGAHGSDLGVRGALTPLFERYRVDIVFTGHDHHYERTHPLAGGKPVPPGQRGVVYVVTGGAGAPLYPVGASDFTAFARSVYHFVRVEVNGCGLTLEAIDSQGTVFDRLALDKCPFSWIQVNDDGFGEHPGQPYTGQEGFDLAVFDGQLYVGMEGQYCARIWRTRRGVQVPTGQDDWEQVVDNGFDGQADCAVYPPTTDNDHIDSLQEFNGYLYASTAMQTADQRGTQVWRSASGDRGSWVPVNRPGFGLRSNENFKDMVVFQGRLCGGTMNIGELADEREPYLGFSIPPGAQVWCTDGVTADPEDPSRLLWTQQNRNGFGEPGNIKVWSSAVFAGHLYVGVEGLTGSIWRTGDIAHPDAWEQVFSSPDAGLGSEVKRMDVLDVLDGSLYIGFERPGYGTQVWRSASGAPGSWTPVVVNGFGHASSGRVISDGAVTYDGALYLAVLDQTHGVGIWRTTDGNAWEQINISGFGRPTTFAAELTAFNGHLYAWTSDYANGQGVWRGTAR